MVNAIDYIVPVLVLAPARTNRHVAHCAAGGPVPLTASAEVTGLVDVVVVEVTEFCVEAFATRAGD